MRFWMIGLGTLALAACDSGSVPSPAERLEGESPEAAAAVDPGLVTLGSEGLTAGAEGFYFSAGQTEVETALSRALGKPGEVMDMPECGAGPMESATFAEALTVNFQDGVLVGWTLSAAADPVVSEGVSDISVCSEGDSHYSRLPLTY